MSDFAKPDVPSDTQDTFFEESESDSQCTRNPNNSTSFEESQDFHLIDTGVSQDFEAELPEGPIKDSGAIDTEDVSMEKENDLAEKSMDNNENKEDIFNNENQTIEGPEDDEDVVHGTPPHCLSSPSKKLSANADVNSLKRKVGSFNDSLENEVSFKKNKVENSEDEFQEETETMEAVTPSIDDADQGSQKEIENRDESLIIPETQESTQDTQPIDDGASKDLEESENIVDAENNLEDTSAKVLDVENEKSFEEECDLVNEAIGAVDEVKLNQNDSTVVNDGDLNESKNISKEIDFSGDVSFPEKEEDVQDKKEIENLVENEPSKDEVVENQSEISENQTDGLENQTDGLENQTDGLENQTDGLENQTDGFENQTDGFENQTDGLENQTDGLENQADGLENQTDGLENQTKNIQEESKLEETKNEESEEQEVKLAKADPIIDEVEKTKSIEDTLKQLGEEMDTVEHLEQPLTEKESTESELLAALTDSDTNADVEEGSGNKEESVKMDTEDIPEKTEAKEVEEKFQLTKSRMSIEVIYDRSSLSQAKPKELVEIDDDGEKIVLDSSQEDNVVRPEVVSDIAKDETVYKSCNSDFSYKSVCSKDSMDDHKSETHLTNGGDDSKNTTADIDSDAKDNTSKGKSEAGVPNPPFYVISDGEGDSMVDDSKNKSLSDNDTLAQVAKTVQVEKDISVCVRLKCLVTIDESTKEVVGKELLTVNCEPMGDRTRNNDTSTSLADISGNDNKDSSPGSVTSQTYPRFSIMSTSTVSSTTSSSSAGSSKVSGQDKMFSVPKGPAKQTKKAHLELDQLSKEWKNCHLVSISVLNFANSELSVVDLQNGVADSLDEPVKKMRASTPEASTETPQRNAKKGRPPKRLQTRGARKRTKVVVKISPNVIDSIQEDSDELSSSNVKETRNKSTIAAGSSVPVKKSVEGLRNAVLPTEEVDEFLGKEVFAKWSDNHYYAGVVADKIKAKYKVNFLDGKSKQLIPEFIVPIPKTLNKGLSVYTLTKEGDYGPCGIIVDILESSNTIKYVIEPDEGKRITVQIKDIFLTGDQAQVLKEESLSGLSSVPSTPHSISKVSLDNMIDGKRRSRRNTSTTNTPKSKKSLTSIINKTLENEPSVSGVSLKSKEAPLSDKDGGKSSDSSVPFVEETDVYGVQNEIIGTFCEQVTMKGPQSRLKGKQRNRRKPDDQETITLLGPIPETKIFEGMSFLLTCASLEGIDKFHPDIGDSLSFSNSDSGTDNEADWQSRPFVRDRLQQQLIAGGGKVYESFDLLPASEYENTKLITNIPNLTAKSLLCLSVGISAYNHLWVIRSCQENKAVNASEEKLPAGWSIDKRCYVEMFHRREQKPLTHIIAVIPRKDEVDRDFVTFWSRICLNAGGHVRVVDNEEISFVEGTVVLTNHRCPKWVIEKAKNWDIPLVSTTWLIQSLIEGKILPYDLHTRFKPF